MSEKTMMFIVIGLLVFITYCSHTANENFKNSSIGSMYEYEF